jgi:abhydrolase domain-containing protein 12
VNFKLVTSDNVALGAWFVLSDTFYQSIPFLSHITTNTSTAEDITSARIRASLAVHPTIIFFHGNAATRAVPARVRHYAAFSSRLRANVLAIDYRGFADSEGCPTEAGLALDARAAWEWVLDHGASPRNVLLVGHSLGTAVAAKLAQQLSADGVELKGLVLLSPFSSITVLLDTYHVMGFLPIATPLAMIPGADSESDHCLQCLTQI